MKMNRCEEILQTISHKILQVLAGILLGTFFIVGWLVLNVVCILWAVFDFIIRIVEGKHGSKRT